VTPDAVRAHYRRTLDQVGENISIRIYSGTTDTYTDYTVRARVMGYAPGELVGPIVQGDSRLVVLASDVTAAGIALNTGANCKVVVRGKELQVKAVDDNTRRIDGELVAYELRVGG
jgi:hypothetical protein